MGESFAVRVDFEDHYAQVRAECRQWCQQPGSYIHGQSWPKSETESTSGSTEMVIFHRKI